MFPLPGNVRVYLNWTLLYQCHCQVLRLQEMQWSDLTAHVLCNEEFKLLSHFLLFCLVLATQSHLVRILSWDNSPTYEKNPKHPTKRRPHQKKKDNFLLDYEIELFLEEFRKCFDQYKEGHRVLVPGAGKKGGNHLRERSEWQPCHFGKYTLSTVLVPKYNRNVHCSKFLNNLSYTQPTMEHVLL